jgi:E3 ubiquitin-protein ligase HUWE1
MKIKHTPTSGLARPCWSPELFSLKDRIAGTKGDDPALLTALGATSADVFQELVDLCDWIGALDRIDSALQAWVGRLALFDDVGGEAEPAPAPAPEDQEALVLGVPLVTCCLRFTEILLSNSFNKGVYSSSEHLLMLLQAREEGVADLALSCLCQLTAALATHRQLAADSSTMGSPIDKKRSVARKLMALGEGWGGRGQGLGLLSCLTEPDDKLSDAPGDLFFEVRCDTEAEAEAGEPARKVTIRESALHQRQSSAADIFEELRRRHRVPLQHCFALLARVRLAVDFGSQESRRRAISRRLNALLTLINSYPSFDLLVSHFHAHPELIQELVDLLRVQLGAPPSRTCVPLNLCSLAASCLAGLVGVRSGSRGGGLSLVARQSNLLGELGAVRGQYTGLLPSLLRCTVADLSSMRARLAAAAAEVAPPPADEGLSLGMAFVAASSAPVAPSLTGEGADHPAAAPGVSAMARDECTVQMEWYEAVFKLVLVVVSSTHGAAALTDCGLIPTILSVVQMSSAVEERSGPLAHQLRYLISLVMSVVEAAVVHHNSALNSFRELGAADILIEAFVYEMQRLIGQGAADAAAAMAVDGVDEKGKGKVKSRVPPPNVGSVGEMGDVGVEEEGRPPSQPPTTLLEAPSPSQRVLLQTLLNGMSMAFHSQGMALTEGSRYLRSGDLTRAIICVFDNIHAFGGWLAAVASSLVSDVMNSDPMSVGFVHSSGIARAFLQAVGRGLPACSEMVVAVPAMLSALSLTSDGSEVVEKADVFPAFFRVFYQAQYALPQSRCLQGDMPCLVGTGIEELMRHVPRLKPSCMVALVEAMKKVVTLADAAQAQGDLLEGEDAHAGSIRRQACTLQFVTHLARLAEPVLSKSEHIGAFFQAGGSEALSDMAPLTILDPRSFLSNASCISNHTTQNLAHYPAVHAVSIAFKSLGGQESGLLLKRLVTELGTCLQNVSSCQESLRALRLEEVTSAGGGEGMDASPSPTATAAAAGKKPEGPDVNLVGILDCVPRTPLHLAAPGRGSLPPVLQAYAALLKELVAVEWLTWLMSVVIRFTHQRSGASSSSPSTISSTLTSGAGRDALRRLVALQRSAQLEMCRSNLEEEEAGMEYSEPDIFLLRIVCTDGAVVRNGADIDACEQISTLEMGAISEAFERGQMANGVMRYRTEFGWVSEHIRGGTRHPIAEVLDIRVDPGAAERDTERDAQPAKGRPHKRPPVATLRGAGCNVFRRLQGGVKNVLSTLTKVLLVGSPRHYHREEAALGFAPHAEALTDFVVRSLSSALRSAEQLAPIAACAYYCSVVDLATAVLYDERRSTINTHALRQLVEADDGSGMFLLLQGCTFVLSTALAKAAPGAASGSEPGKVPPVVLDAAKAVLALLKRLSGSVIIDVSPFTMAMQAQPRRTGEEGKEEGGEPPERPFDPLEMRRKLHLAILDTFLSPILCDQGLHFLPVDVIARLFSMAKELIFSVHSEGNFGHCLRLRHSVLGGGSGRDRHSGAPNVSFLNRSMREYVRSVAPGRLLNALALLGEGAELPPPPPLRQFTPSEATITSLMEMGFGRDHVVQALRATQSNRAEVAMEYLLTYPPPPVSSSARGEQPASSAEGASTEAVGTDVPSEAGQDAEEPSGASAAAASLPGASDEPSSPQGDSAATDDRSAEEAEAEVRRMEEQLRVQCGESTAHLRHLMENLCDVCIFLVEKCPNTSQAAGNAALASSPPEFSPEINVLVAGFVTEVLHKLKPPVKASGSAAPTESVEFPSQDSFVLSILRRIRILFDGAAGQPVLESSAAASLLHVLLLLMQVAPSRRQLLIDGGLCEFLLRDLKATVDCCISAGPSSGVSWPPHITSSLLVLDLLTEAAPDKSDAESAAAGDRADAASGEMDGATDAPVVLSPACRVCLRDSHPLHVLADCLFCGSALQHSPRCSQCRRLVTLPLKDVDCQRCGSTLGDAPTGNENAACFGEHPSRPPPPPVDDSFLDVLGLPRQKLAIKEEEAKEIAAVLSLILKASAAQQLRPLSHSMAQAVLQLLAHVLKGHDYACVREFVVVHGGMSEAVKSLLDLPGACAFEGRTALLAAVFKCFLEDSVTLQSVMEVEMRSAFARLARTRDARVLNRAGRIVDGANRDKLAPGQFVAVRLFPLLNYLAPLVARDRRVFAQAAKAVFTIAHQDPNTKRSLVTLKPVARPMPAAANHPKDAEEKPSPSQHQLDPKAESDVTAPLSASNKKGKGRAKAHNRSTPAPEKMRNLDASCRECSAIVISLLLSRVVSAPVPGESDPDAEAEPSEFVSLVDGLELLSDLVASYPSCANAFHRCGHIDSASLQMAEWHHAVRDCDPPPRTMVNYLLHVLLAAPRGPDEALTSGGDAADRKRRRARFLKPARVAQYAGLLLLALCIRPGESRKRVLQELVRALRCSRGNASPLAPPAQAGEIWALQAWGELALGLMAPRATTSSGRYAAEGAPSSALTLDVVRQLLDMGVIPAITAALCRVDLQAPRGGACATALVRPLELVTRSSVYVLLEKQKASKDGSSGEHLVASQRTPGAPRYRGRMDSAARGAEGHDGGASGRGHEPRDETPHPDSQDSVSVMPVLPPSVSGGGEGSDGDANVDERVIAAVDHHIAEEEEDHEIRLNIVLGAPHGHRRRHRPQERWMLYGEEESVSESGSSSIADDDEDNDDDNGDGDNGMESSSGEGGDSDDDNSSGSGDSDELGGGAHGVRVLNSSEEEDDDDLDDDLASTSEDESIMDHMDDGVLDMEDGMDVEAAVGSGEGGGVAWTGEERSGLLEMSDEEEVVDSGADEAEEDEGYIIDDEDGYDGRNQDGDEFSGIDGVDAAGGAMGYRLFNMTDFVEPAAGSRAMWLSSPTNTFRRGELGGPNLVRIVRSLGAGADQIMQTIYGRVHDQQHAQHLHQPAPPSTSRLFPNGTQANFRQRDTAFIHPLLQSWHRVRRQAEGGERRRRIVSPSASFMPPEPAEVDEQMLMEAIEDSLTGASEGYGGGSAATSITFTGGGRFASPWAPFMRGDRPRMQDSAGEAASTGPIFGGGAEASFASLLDRQEVLEEEQEEGGDGHAGGADSRPSSPTSPNSTLRASAGSPAREGATQTAEGSTAQPLELEDVDTSAHSESEAVAALASSLSLAGEPGEELRAEAAISPSTMSIDTVPEGGRASGEATALDSESRPDEVMEEAEGGAPIPMSQDDEVASSPCEPLSAGVAGTTTEDEVMIEAEAVVEADAATGTPPPAPAGDSREDGEACPPGIDPDVFAVLPPEMRAELLREHGMDSATSSAAAESSIDPEILAALPPELRQEVLENEARERQRRERDAASAAQGAAEGGSGAQAQEMDNASFVASLAPDLRQEILMNADEAFLSTLPPNLVAEAMLMREREPRGGEEIEAAAATSAVSAAPRASTAVPSRRRRGGDASRGPSASSPSAQEPDHAGMIAVTPDLRRPRDELVISSEALAMVLSLLHLRNAMRPHRLLQRLLLNLCSSQEQVRLAIVFSLVGLATGNQADVRKSLHSFLLPSSSADLLEATARRSSSVRKGKVRALKIASAGGHGEDGGSSSDSEHDERRGGAGGGPSSPLGRGYPFPPPHLLGPHRDPAQPESGGDAEAEPVVARRVLDMLTHLAKGSTRVCLTVLNGLAPPCPPSQHAGKRKSHSKGKHPSSALAAQAPGDEIPRHLLEQVISLLDRPLYVLSSTNLDNLLGLILVLTNPLSQLKEASPEDVETPEAEAAGAAAAERVTAASTPSPAGGAAAGTAGGKGVSSIDGTISWECIPAPTVSADSLRLLCSVLRLEACSESIFARASSVMTNLSKISSNRSNLLKELVSVTQLLGQDSERDLTLLYAQLTQLQEEQALAHAAKSDAKLEPRPSLLTPSAVTMAANENELKLLRVLQTLRTLASPNTEFLNETLGSLGLDSLWDALSRCLVAVSVLEGVTEAEDVDDDQGDMGEAQRGHEESKGGEGGTGDSAALNSSTSSFGDRRRDRIGSGSVTGAEVPATSTKQTAAMAGLLARFLPMVEAFFVVNARPIVPPPETELDEDAAPESGPQEAGGTVEPPALPALSRKSSLSRLDMPGARFRRDVPVNMRPFCDGEEVERAGWGESGAQGRLSGFASRHKALLNALLHQNPGLLDRSLSSMVLNPRCRMHLDFHNKRAYFRAQLRRLRQHSTRRHGSLRLSVPRQQVFEYSYHQLRIRSAEEMRGRLHITFHGEEGIDAGGLTREWYSILAREIFNANYALFNAAVDGVTFQPNPLSKVNPDHLQYFKFVGRIVGKAIADGQLLDAHFTHSFYKHILGVPVSYQDMETIDPTYYKNLAQILEMPLDDLGLELTFSADRNEFGRIETVDLIAGGRRTLVTDENKLYYVQLIAHHRMTSAIRPQIEAFLEGFHELVPPELISIFTPKELELLISGLPDIDLDDLYSNTEYQNFKPSDPEIQMFWAVLRSFTREEKALFLQFVTGTSKVPLEGFAQLQGMRGVQKFNIHRAYKGASVLPSSHACFNQLDLPTYESEEQTREKLLVAIREGATFGFA